MKRMMLARPALFVLVAAILLLAGCGTSPPSRFYALKAVKVQENTGQATTAAQTVLLAVGPIQIPDYLNRPQIVTLTAQNQLAINEFERWGGSLRDDIDQALTENLAAHLASEGVAVVSWRGPVPGAYRVPVEVNRFDAVPGGSVQLKAMWGISTSDGTKVLLVSGSTITQPVNGKDYSAVVAAMSQSIGTLSQEIAAGVKSLLAAGSMKALGAPGLDSGKTK